MIAHAAFVAATVAVATMGTASDGSPALQHPYNATISLALLLLSDAAYCGDDEVVTGRRRRSLTSRAHRASPHRT